MSSEAPVNEASTDFKSFYCVRIFFTIMWKTAEFGSFGIKKPAKKFFLAGKKKGKTLYCMMNFVETVPFSVSSRTM